MTKKTPPWRSDDFADFFLKAEHVVQRDAFGGFCIPTADRLKHESLFVQYLIEPRHQCGEPLHRHVKDPKREIVVMVERVEEVGILGAAIDEAMDAPIEREQRVKL